MRCANEPIARKANEEDEVTGRFWEGRFKSQALLDEQALIACMAYVDLNPIRARIADTPEHSDYTSIQQRIQAALKTPPPADLKQRPQQPENLLPFAGYPREDMPAGLPFQLTDYMELVDWSGRSLREDKKGAITADVPPILQRLDMEAKQFLYLAKNFESPFKNLVGAAHKVRKVCQG